MMSATHTTRPSIVASAAASRQQQRPRGSLVVRATSEQLKKPELAAKPAQAPAAEGSIKPAMAASGSSASGVTVEYQRQQAKEMQKYFRRLVFEEEVKKSQVFGWTRKNEISNGRWVMFGLLVGVLTEYATGVSFPDQLRMMVSFLGIADVYD